MERPLKLLYCLGGFSLGGEIFVFALLVDVLEVVLGDYYSLSLCRFRSTFLTWYVPKLTRVPSKEVGTI